MEYSYNALENLEKVWYTKSGTWDVFWYEKNLQGDVISVYNNAGTKLATYKYDAFGGHTTTYIPTVTKSTFQICCK